MTPSLWNQVRLADGRWAALEIKMSATEVDAAARNLIRLRDKIDTDRQLPPAALVVVTATGSAGRRADCVHVAPITCLKP